MEKEGKRKKKKEGRGYGRREKEEEEIWEVMMVGEARGGRRKKRGRVVVVDVYTGEEEEERRVGERRGRRCLIFYFDLNFFLISFLSQNYLSERVNFLYFLDENTLVLTVKRNSNGQNGRMYLFH